MRMFRGVDEARKEVEQLIWNTSSNFAVDRVYHLDHDHRMVRQLFTLTSFIYYLETEQSMKFAR